MPTNEVPRRSSIDMTLALGADSYLRQRNAGPDGVFLDPVGRTCLKDLIDVIVNSEECFLTLPSNFEYVSRPPLMEYLTNLKPLPNCAAVRLRESVEERIFYVFWETVKTLGQDWVSQWFKSQFWNPIVTEHHHPRLGTTARIFKTITDEGWESWNRRVSPSFLTTLIPLAAQMPNEPYLAEDIKKADDSLVSFQYGYAFDVFRRGWQYAEAARQHDLGISYCPHQFRRRALDGGSDGWLEAARETFWSWGQCIVHAVDTVRTPIQAGQVAEWIHGLLAAGVPRWIDVPDLTVKSEENERSARDLIEKLHEISLSVGIPLSRWHLGTNRLRDRLEIGIADMSFQVLSAGDVLDVNTSQPDGKALTAFHKMSRPSLTRGGRASLTTSVDITNKAAPDVEQEHGHILRILKNMASIMERSPHTFESLSEEDIRTHFLMHLNADYGGKVTGETFNGAGKTDLLIRVNNRNIFIAECKFWRGEKYLLEALDQLLSYLTWHDTRAALLIFCRNKNFSDVLTKIGAGIPKHHHCSEDLGKMDETIFRHYFQHPEDTARKIMVTTMAFVVPSLQSGS